MHFPSWKFGLFKNNLDIAPQKIDNKENQGHFDHYI